MELRSSSIDLSEISLNTRVGQSFGKFAAVNESVMTIVLDERPLFHPALRASRMLMQSRSTPAATRIVSADSRNFVHRETTVISEFADGCFSPLREEGTDLMLSVTICEAAGMVFRRFDAWF